MQQSAVNIDMIRSSNSTSRAKVNTRRSAIHVVPRVQGRGSQRFVSMYTRENTLCDRRALSLTINALSALSNKLRAIELNDS